MVDVSLVIDRAELIVLAIAVFVSIIGLLFSGIGLKLTTREIQEKNLRSEIEFLKDEIRSYNELHSAIHQLQFTIFKHQANQAYFLKEYDFSTNGGDELKRIYYNRAGMHIPHYRSAIESFSKCSKIVGYPLKNEETSFKELDDFFQGPICVLEFEGEEVSWGEVKIWEYYSTVPVIGLHFKKEPYDLTTSKGREDLDEYLSNLKKAIELVIRDKKIRCEKRWKQLRTLPTKKL